MMPSDELDSLARLRADQRKQLAGDPSTPIPWLRALARYYPVTLPAVAANPATDPDLLAWLGGLGDPAVEEALRARAVAELSSQWRAGWTQLREAAVAAGIALIVVVTVTASIVLG